MTRRAAFIRGVMAGLLLAGAAQAIHWFLTPWARGWINMVWLQLIVCVVGVPVMTHSVRDDAPTAWA